MWESLVSEKHIIEYIKHRKEEEDNLIRNNIQVSGLNPVQIISYICKMVDKFLDMIYKNLNFVRESKQYALPNYFPFMKQVNRIMINLAYELFDVFQSTKNDDVKNIALNNLQYTYDRSIELGEKLDTIENFDIVNYITCPIIIGHFLVSCGVVEGNKYGLKHLENKSESKFGIECIFGIKFIVHLYKKKNDNYNLENEMYNDLIKKNLEDIKSVFFRSELDYEKYEKEEVRFPRSPLHFIHDFLGSIEMRYGKTDGKHILISNLINQIVLMLSDISFQKKRNSFFQLMNS